MRLLPAVLLTSAMSWIASGQTYTISTFAGGGLPVNIPGTSASIGMPQVLAADPAGNVFFVDQDTVLRLDATTGILTLVAGNGTTGFSGDNGPATSAQLDLPPSNTAFPGGLALDASGNLYIADIGNSRVRKVSNGVITTVAGNGTYGFSGDGGPATSAQLADPNGIAVDSAGNLYIADAAYSRVRKVSNGVITTVAGSGTHGFSGDNGSATSAQLYTPEAVALDAAGNLYIADSDNFRVRKVAAGVITTVAGNGMQGFSGDSGPATSAQLSIPVSVAVDSAGNLYIADNGNGRIRKVSNGVITTVAGNGTQGFSFSGDGGPATSVGLSAVCIAVDSAGNLYIADFSNGRIRKVSNGVIATIAGNGPQGSGGDNGPATSAQLNGPEGVAVDSAGNLYIADYNNQRIRKVSNGVITTVAGNGTPGFSGDNGPATSAQLNFPDGIAVDSTGNLYIADYENNRVRRVSNSVITTVAGNGTPGFSGDNGPATSAQLNGPGGVAVDSAGNLYIAEYENNRVRKVSNGVITTAAGNGTSGSSGDNGPATSAQLNGAVGVAVDSAGNLYIDDGDNGRIRKVSNGIITTVAGVGTVGPSFGDNGPATRAGLNPGQLTVDSTGSLYISDSGASIRRVSNGVITTVAGNGTTGFSGDNGPATSAQFDGAGGIAADSAGNVYVADYGNNRIRVLIPSGPSCSASVTPLNASVVAAGGNLSVAIQTTASCAWAVQSLPPWITYSGNPVGAGPAAIALVVSVNPGPARSATVSVAGIPVSVTQSSLPPSIYAGGIVNAASYAAGMPLAQGSIATAYGSFPLLAPVSAAGSPLPTSLAGISMQFGNGLQAPLFFADVGQVNFQVPWELAGQSQASLAAALNGQAAAPQTVSLAPFSPGIFSTNAEGTGQGAILNSSYLLVDSSHPATAGSTVVQIYCTGLGAVTNQPATGSPAPNSPLSMTRNGLTVTIGGAQATVMFSGLAPGFVGGYQVDALVPAESAKGAAVPVVIAIGGVTSNTVTIAVQ